VPSPEQNIHVHAEVERWIVPSPVGAQADEEVLDVRAPAATDILADDPIAIFHEQDFIADPVARIAGRASREAGRLFGNPGRVGGRAFG